MQRHLDGDLHEEEHKRMSEHLDACPECADMMERLQQIDKDLANLPKVMPAYSLVDSILPRLAQLDAAMPDARLDAAASEMHLVKTERPAVAGEFGGGSARKRPWYARGKFAQIGGLAAAAAVFGILIVNGLPKSLDQASMESTSAGSPASEERVMEFRAADTSAADMAVPMEEPEAEAPMAKSSAAPEGTANVASTKEPSGESVPMVGAEEPAKGKAEANDVNVAEVTPAPNPLLDTAEPQEASEPEATPEPVPIEAAPSVEGGGSIQGITGEPVPDNVGEPAPEIVGDAGDGGEGIHGIMGIEEQYRLASLASDSGEYEAMVQPKSEDGQLSVVVVNGAGETVFVSARLWDPSVPIELTGWNGAVLTYAATTADGETLTFSIDAAAGTETQIQ
ncbi:zf-HC2 domain-containing protein [Paenibacillus sp. TRM 82003]|nr:zf-HC2 domain-containing protein [Paenibacillus sp. TRM 82003]